VPVSSTLTGPIRNFAIVSLPVLDFRKSWATACDVAKAPGKLFHDLRRSVVRDMVRAGIAPTIARGISGHRSDAVFERYDIVSGKDMKEALEKHSDTGGKPEKRDRRGTM
jgi:integrase